MSFLFVDRILSLAPGEHVTGVKHITPSDVYLQQDAAGRYQFMPSILGETLGQLGAWAVMQANDFQYRPVAGVVSSVTLHSPVYLGDSVFLETHIDALDEKAIQYHSEARVNNQTVFTIDSALGPMLPMDEFISQDEIKRQFQQIYRPGEWQAPMEMQLQASPMHTASALTQYDGIAAFTPNESVTAIKHISLQSPYFADHFPRKPVLPLTILLQSQSNLGHWFFQQSNHPAAHWPLKQLRKIKMNEFVQPGSTVETQCQLKNSTDHSATLVFKSFVAGKRVCVSEAYFEGEPHE